MWYAGADRQDGIEEVVVVEVTSSGCIEFAAFVVDVGGEGERQGGESYCCELGKQEEEVR